MIAMMIMIYNGILRNDYTPKRSREGVVVNLFKNGDKADPGNYRRITLLRTGGNVFCKIRNDSVGTMLGKEGQKTRENRF